MVDKDNKLMVKQKGETNNQVTHTDGNKKINDNECKRIANQNLKDFKWSNYFKE